LAAETRRRKTLMSATKRCPCRDICVARYQVKGPIAGHRLQVLCASECVRGAGSGLLLAEGAANTGTPGYDLHDVVDKCGSHRNGANSFPHDAGAICRVAEALWRRIDAPCVIFSTHFRVLLLQCAVEQRCRTGTRIVLEIQRRELARRV
jgi:hypothetical protein